MKYDKFVLTYTLTCVRAEVGVQLVGVSSTHKACQNLKFSSTLRSCPCLTSLTSSGMSYLREIYRCKISYEDSTTNNVICFNRTTTISHSYQSLNPLGLSEEWEPLILSIVSTLPTMTIDSLQSLFHWVPLHSLHLSILFVYNILCASHIFKNLNFVTKFKE